MDDEALRKQLTDLLSGGNAHAGWKNVLGGVPEKARGVRPKTLPHSLWDLLEHLRIAQWDILEFSRDPKHVSPDWPKGYWPASPQPPSARAWGRSLKAFEADLKAMIRLVGNPKVDLFAKIPHGDGQTILREALLVADHNAYHLGQFALVRRALGAWKD